MCTSTPKVQQPVAPPKIETMDPTGNQQANKAMELRRKRMALSSLKTAQGGAMQGEGAKDKMGA